jgi:two-component system, cell cycle sensor histidine kinase and response regulator CckA
MNPEANILVVEDQRVVARSIGEQLKQLGYGVAGLTASADEAVQLAEKLRPDLVLMDVRLDGRMDGIEAAARIRESLQLPVVYLTAYADEETLRRAKITEPFGYILKPFDERELRATIEMALYKHETERRMRESERRYAVTLASIGDAVIATDVALRIAFINTAAQALTGWRGADAVGVPLGEVFRIVNEFTRQPAEDPAARVLREGQVVGLANHTLLLSRDGREIPIDDCGAPIIDDFGRVSGVVLVFHDVSEQRRAQADLALFRKLLDFTNDAIEIIDPATGRILDVNERACRAHGYTREEYLALTVAHLDESITPGEWPAKVDELRRRGSLVLESHHRRKDGSVFPVEVNVTFVHLQRDYVLAVVRDITDRQRADEHIRRLNRTYAVLSHINQLIVRTREPQAILDGACAIAVEQGRFVMAFVALRNAAGGAELAAHAGVVPETMSVLQSVLRDLSASCPCTWRAFAKGEHAVCNDLTTERHGVDCYGHYLQRGIRSLVALPIVVAGRPAGVLNLCASEAGFFDAEEMRLLDELALDIGYALEFCEQERERRRAVEELRASEERFRELAETIQEVFWIVDARSHRIVYASPAYRTIWGRVCEELYQPGRAWPDAVHPEDVARVRNAAAERMASGTYDEEYRIVRPDGSVRWIRDHAFPVRNTAGQVERVAGVARDITDARLIAEQLRQSQKMEAIGRLAGGVAHDFNNILTAITMQVEITGMAADLSPSIRDDLHQIRAAAERAAALTRQLLLFSRQQVMQTRDIDLNETVTSLARMLQRIIGEDVRLLLDLHPTPLTTRADAGMLDQVLLNLAVNARDAMPGGGRLVIKTAERQIDRAVAQVHSDAAPGRFVTFSVSDTGSGIPAEILPQIFEPFFTTKEPGKGTGLGLATAFGIVKQHHGWITVESEPGQGATFTVFLPAFASPAAAGSPGATVARPSPGGTEAILLVEDETAVRTLTRALLERHGYRVWEAATGIEALQIWEQKRDEIALVLTDVVMPAGISGHDLARRLQREKPALKVIYVSGYSAEIASREVELRPGENYLQKPFPADLLLQTLRRSLDA